MSVLLSLRHRDSGATIVVETEADGEGGLTAWLRIRDAAGAATVLRGRRAPVGNVAAVLDQI